MRHSPSNDRRRRGYLGNPQTRDMGRDDVIVSLPPRSYPPAPKDFTRREQRIWAMSRVRERRAHGIIVTGWLSRMAKTGYVR